LRRSPNGLRRIDSPIYSSTFNLLIIAPAPQEEENRSGAQSWIACATVTELESGVEVYRNPKAGFTLVELLVVIAVIALLRRSCFPVLASARARAAADRLPQQPVADRPRGAHVCRGLRRAPPSVLARRTLATDPGITLQPYITSLECGMPGPGDGATPLHRSSPAAAG